MIPSISRRLAKLSKRFICLRQTTESAPCVRLLGQTIYMYIGKVVGPKQLYKIGGILKRCSWNSTRTYLFATILYNNFQLTVVSSFENTSFITEAFQTFPSLLDPLLLFLHWGLTTFNQSTFQYEVLYWSFYEMLQKHMCCA